MTEGGSGGVGVGESGREGGRKERREWVNESERVGVKGGGKVGVRQWVGETEVVGRR